MLGIWITSLLHIRSSWMQSLRDLFSTLHLMSVLCVITFSIQFYFCFHVACFAVFFFCLCIAFFIFLMFYGIFKDVVFVSELCFVENPDHIFSCTWLSNLRMARNDRKTKIIVNIGNNLKVHGHVQTHSCNLCRFELDI